MIYSTSIVWLSVVFSGSIPSRRARKLVLRDTQCISSCKCLNRNYFFICLQQPFELMKIHPGADVRLLTLFTVWLFSWHVVFMAQNCADRQVGVARQSRPHSSTDEARRLSISRPVSWRSFCKQTTQDRLAGEHSCRASGTKPQSGTQSIKHMAV